MGNKRKSDFKRALESNAISIVGPGRRHKFMASRHDGGASPLGDKIELPEWGTSVAHLPDVAYAGVLPADTDTALHPTMNLTSQYVADDIEAMVRGDHRPLRSSFVRDHMRARGLDPDNMPRMSDEERRKLHNMIVESLHKKVRERDASQRLTVIAGSVLQALLSGFDRDIMALPDGTNCTVEQLRGVLSRHFGVDPVRLAQMEQEPQHRMLRRSIRRLHADFPRTRPEVVRKREAMRLERNALHDSLEAWASGPLRFESPRASWLRHLLRYDEMAVVTPKFAIDVKREGLQSIVVENDWAAAVPPSSGEWHTPFRDCCWEFDLSGVRVMAITSAEEEGRSGDLGMILVYGRGGVWVSDDHAYTLSESTLMRWRVINRNTDAPKEFLRVAEYAARLVRACCITLDAQVTEKIAVACATRSESGKSRSGSKEPPPPPRDWYVVRLMRQHRQGPIVAHSAGAGTGAARAPQRGHWRQGTWVHYDDPSSGEVRYADEAGVQHSKSWRRWHFAGDPRNIIHKEYRL